MYLFSIFNKMCPSISRDDDGDRVEKIADTHGYYRGYAIR